MKWAAFKRKYGEMIKKSKTELQNVEDKLGGKSEK